MTLVARKKIFRESNFDQKKSRVKKLKFENIPCEIIFGNRGSEPVGIGELNISEFDDVIVNFICAAEYFSVAAKIAVKVINANVAHACSRRTISKVIFRNLIFHFLNHSVDMIFSSLENLCTFSC